MKVGILATMILGALIGCPIASFAGPPPCEGDCDGVPDVLDNCSEVPNAGALDCDTDQDGYGNACDCDLTNASGCNAADLIAWKNAFKAAPQTNFNANHNCSAEAAPINAADLIIWKGLFKNVGTRFKSGLDCANPNVAGSCPN